MRYICVMMLSRNSNFKYKRTERAILIKNDFSYIIKLDYNRI